MPSVLWPTDYCYVCGVEAYGWLCYTSCLSALQPLKKEEKEGRNEGAYIRPLSHPHTRSELLSLLTLRLGKSLRFNTISCSAKKEMTVKTTSVTSTQWVQNFSLSL